MAAAHKEPVSAGTGRENTTNDPGPDVVQEIRVDQLPPPSTGGNLLRPIKEEPSSDCEKPSDWEKSKKSSSFSSKQLHIKVRCFRCSICKEQFEEAALCIAHVNSHRKDASDNKKTAEKQTPSSSKTDAVGALSEADGNSNLQYEPEKATEKQASPASQAIASSVAGIPDVNICRKDGASGSKTSEKPSMSSRQMHTNDASCLPVSSHSKDKAETGAKNSEQYATFSSKTATPSKRVFPGDRTQRERPIRLLGFQKKPSSSLERALMSKPRLRILIHKLTEREVQLRQYDGRAIHSSLTAGIGGHPDPETREQSKLSASQFSASNFVANKQNVIMPNRTLIPPVEQHHVSRERNTIEASWLTLSGDQIHVSTERHTKGAYQPSLGDHQTIQIHLNRGKTDTTSSTSGGRLQESETTSTNRSAPSLSHSNESGGSLPERRNTNINSSATLPSHSKVCSGGLQKSRTTNINSSATLPSHSKVSYGSLPQSKTTNMNSPATLPSHVSNVSSGSLQQIQITNIKSCATFPSHSKVSSGGLRERRTTNMNSSAILPSSSNDSGNFILGDEAFPASSNSSASTGAVRFPNRVNSSLAETTAGNRTIIVIDGDIPPKYKMLANLQSEETILRGRQAQDMPETSRTTEMGGKNAQETRPVDEHPATSAPYSAESRWDPGSKENSLINEFGINSINTTTTASGTKDPDGCPRYVCCYCRTEFVSFGTCNLHMKTVHGTAAIKPDKVIEAGAGKSILKRHVYEEKSQISGKFTLMFMCSLCPRQCLSLEDCNAHMASCHSEFLKQKRMEEIERERTSRKRKGLQPSQNQETVPVKKSRGSASLGVDDMLSSGQANVEEILQLCNNVLQEKDVGSVQRTTSFDDEKQLKVTIITVGGVRDEGCRKYVRLADPSRLSDRAEGMKENIVPSGSLCAMRSGVGERVRGNTDGLESESDGRSAGADIVKEKSCNLGADPTVKPDGVEKVEEKGNGSDSDPGVETVLESCDEPEPAVTACVPEMSEEKTGKSEPEPARRSDRDKRAKEKADKTKVQVPYTYMCAVCSQKFSTLEECCNHMRSTHNVEQSSNSPTTTPAQDCVGELQNDNGKEDSDDIRSKLPGSTITYACSACMQKFPTNEDCSNHILEAHPVMSPATLKKKKQNRIKSERRRQRKRDLRELANQREREKEKLVKQKEREERKQERKRQRIRRREQRRIAKLTRRRKRAQQEKTRLRKEFYASHDLLNCKSESAFRRIQKNCGLPDQPKCYDCSKYSKGLDKGTNQKIMDGLKKKKDWMKDRICGKEVSSLFLIQHYYECYICREAYRFNYHYKRHMERHTDVVCPMCRMSFQNHHAMANHVSIHNCGPLRCEECSETFYRSKGLLNHMLSHEKLFRCNICQETYGNKMNLKRHIQIRHEHKKKFKCDRNECGASFYSPYLLNEHVNAVHENKKEHICHVCGERYKNHRYLRWHMSIHEDAKFICEQCGCWFQETSQLILHKQRVHSAGNVCKLKKRQAPLWKKYTFKRKQFDYTAAVLRCVVCAEAFGNLSLWKAHVEQHRDTESGQFKCSLCPLEFAEYSVLRDHADDHYKLTLMHGCQLCGQVYPTEEDMHGHKCSFLSRPPPPVAESDEPRAEAGAMTSTNSKVPVGPQQAVQPAPKFPTLDPIEGFLKMSKDKESS